MKRLLRISRRPFYLGAVVCAASLLTVTVYAQSQPSQGIRYWNCPRQCPALVPVKRCWSPCCNTDRLGQKYCAYCTNLSLFLRITTPGCAWF